MKRYYLYILCALMVITSCVEESFKGNFIKAEGEVQFKASVFETPATKTVYGGIDGNKQAVYWTHNDEITVFGASCTIAQADYNVSVVKTDESGNAIIGEDGNPEINKTQHYATDLNKKYDYGVQWGDAAITDFYAVYPAVASGNSFVANGVDVKNQVTPDGETVKVVTTESATVTANISTEQSVYFTQIQAGTNSIGWQGAHYHDNIHNPTSYGALMYVRPVLIRVPIRWILAFIHSQQS